MRIIGLVIVAIFVGLLAAIGILCFVVGCDDALIERLIKEQEKENDY